MEKARAHYENLALSSACEAVLEIGNAGNLYINEQAPWSLFKQGGTASATAAKVPFLLEIFCLYLHFCFLRLVSWESLFFQ